MWNTFKYTVKALVQEKSCFVWALAFPLIMATLFGAMFANLDSAHYLNPIPTAVVDDARYRNAQAFSETLEALAKSGENQLLDLFSVKSSAEADELLKNGTIIGYYQVDEKEQPELFITAASGNSINQTILKNLADGFIQTQAALKTIAENNPQAFADPNFLENLQEQTNYTQEISIIANEASGSVRYFYALLGFAAIMAANIAVIAVTQTQANLSPLGARRSLGATSRTKALLASLLASWLLAFLCLIITFAYMRYVLDINFGRDLASILGLGVASLMTTALGAFIGAIPKIGEMLKAGILTVLSCFFALFAGLYGEPSLKLADDMNRIAPLFQKLNPSRQVTDLFYSLYFYDGFDEFYRVVFVLLAMAAVLFLLAALLMRRQRYASL
ncbi:MAG: ABC transporter permease [Eggerthellaceae bacterium]|nr:ABC transporter permease [Eggerthellaceae bacterium]